MDKKLIKESVRLANISGDLACCHLRIQEELPLELVGHTRCPYECGHDCCPDW